MYGIKFPDSPKKSDLMKESMQLKAALRGRPLTVLANLPMAEDSSMFLLLKELIVYANFSGNHDLVCLISDRSISLALQRGLSKDLMTILTIRAGFLARDTSKLKAANKFAAAAEQVLEPFREENKVLCAETNFRLTVTVFALLRPFRECGEKSTILATITHLPQLCKCSFIVICQNERLKPLFSQWTAPSFSLSTV